MAARKTTATRKRAGTRRKSTAEPKTIIRRKRTAGKKTAASKRTAAKKTTAVDRLATANKQGAQLVDLIDVKGKTLDFAANKLGMSKGKARRLYLRASVKKGDKIVGTDKEIAKKVVAARDKEGVSWPELSARTGKSVRSLRLLYEETTGNAPTRTAKKSDDEEGTTKRGRKTGRTRKAATSKAKRGGTAPKAAARGRRAKRAKQVETENESSAGIPKGRRARRAHLTDVLENKIWDLDTDNDEVAKLLTGRTIEVSRNIDGRAMRPTEHEVVKVKDVQLHDREGKLIEFVDENKQSRFVATREITALK